MLCKATSKVSFVVLSSRLSPFTLPKTKSLTLSLPNLFIVPMSKVSCFTLESASCKVDFIIFNSFWAVSEFATPLTASISTIADLNSFTNCSCTSALDCNFSNALKFIRLFALTFNLSPSSIICKKDNPDILAKELLSNSGDTPAFPKVIFRPS